MQLDLLSLFIAAVWFVNGLYCKVFGFVPRHRAIVGRILGETHADLITKAIGIAEICMTAWIVSGIQSRLNALTQIVIVAAMNVLEYFLARDLLLWGRANAFIAFLFVILIYYRQFVY